MSAIALTPNQIWNFQSSLTGSLPTASRGCERPIGAEDLVDELRDGVSFELDLPLPNSPSDLEGISA